MASEKAIAEEPIGRRSPQPIKRLLRCAVCDRVLGRYPEGEPRHVIIKCQRCGVLQTRHLQ